MRTCGDCSCSVGKGCQIYETRPQSCRDFECLWLQNEDIPEDLKPSEVKAVMSMNMNGEIILVHTDPANPDVWKKGRLGVFLQQVSQRVPVIVVCSDKRKILTPESMAHNGVLWHEEQIDGSVLGHHVFAGLLNSRTPISLQHMEEWKWKDGVADKTRLESHE